LSRYKDAHPDLARAFTDAMEGILPADWDADLPLFEDGAEGQATRQSSGAALNALAKRIPTLFGGSADLAGSNETTVKGAEMFQSPDYSGRNIWFGVREHAMGAILNGMAVHGGLRVYGGTFMVFSDYLRPAIRLASLMHLPVTYVFTHDSIGVGEDGPTHQPVEQMAALRVIPNLVAIRPADANETIAAWRYSLGHRDHPVALALTRQKLPILPKTKELAKEGVERGGYILAKESGQQADLILIASGSEVSLAMEAKAKLDAEGIDTRVVSMPSFALFEAQPATYRQEVLPPRVHARVGIEMLHPFGWDRYIGDAGRMIAIDHFGASAPAGTLMKEFGFTVEAIVAAAHASRAHAAELFGGK
ncbi:MAG: transketolase, partial [Firmicutes bacterium]|nr:transketolase [Bacillota bacterium]